MHIPYQSLSGLALKSIVEEFVTRDGTDHSSIERRIASVLQQLRDGQVELHFDSDTQTCNVLPAAAKPRESGQSE